MTETTPYHFGAHMATVYSTAAPERYANHTWACPQPLHTEAVTPTRAGNAQLATQDICARCSASDAHGWELGRTHSRQRRQSRHHAGEAAGDPVVAQVQGTDVQAHPQRSHPDHHPTQAALPLIPTLFGCQEPHRTTQVPTRLLRCRT
jgi:hypothetical protein